MRFSRIPALLGLAALLCAPVGAAERNEWPLWVGQTDAGGDHVESWHGAGPLFFSQPLDDGNTAAGFRPVYFNEKNAAGQVTAAYFLYPLFTWRADANYYRWSIYSLINWNSSRAGRGETDRGFDVWPFYFSRETGDPATSYHAVFPLAGQVTNRFGDDRISWLLFPLYGRFEKHGMVTTAAPWPFIRITEGGGNRGFQFWPLFGQVAKAGVYRDQFCLWPLIYKNERWRDGPAPDVQLGFLPFYARAQSAGAISETWLWPFFGYTHRTAPDRYDERRYFWPLLVQGRGDTRYVNRWAPVYTHSVAKGVDKTWLLWPLWRQSKWDEGGLALTKSELLYFVYWSEEQRSLAHPALAPAWKTHLWPLVSVWDNGAGRRQVQLPSPLEVFFPANEIMRLAYSPLFALYRYDRRAPGDVRQSFLFDFITWRREAARTEFHLGPLLSVERRPAQERIALGNGLLGIRRRPGQRVWHLFWLDFHPQKGNNRPGDHP